eukprot:GHRQ01031434.1.p3 GENE.GHRQ01031434.1~~GHRQ01031434.1.p3  ORF type:complete len:137 (+),score=17.03 GHRQ01031434.1:432-842(+)
MCTTPGQIQNGFESIRGYVCLFTTRSALAAVQGLSPASVPSWQRVRAANLLASNGSAWVDIFKRHNSGTYNNQVRPARTCLGACCCVPAALQAAVAYTPTCHVSCQCNPCRLLQLPFPALRAACLLERCELSVTDC